MNSLRSFGACALAAAGFVYSSAGQIQAAGNHQINLDASGLPVDPVRY